MNKEKLQNIKLVVFDLDGTLLDEDNEIGSETLELVAELRKKNIQFTIASGRINSAIKEHADKLEINLPVISLEGALIKDLNTDENIFSMYLSSKHVKRALAFANKYQINISLSTDHNIFYTQSNSIIPQLTDRLGADFVKVDNYENYLENTLEILMVGEHRLPIKYVNDKFHFPYAIGVKSAYYKSQTHDDVFYLEARKKGASKGNGLKKLCSHLGYNINETAVIGDWYNDISMFQTDAYKVAVGNAVKELKALADYTTKRSFNEDAPAEFLSILLKAKS